MLRKSAADEHDRIAAAPSHALFLSSSALTEK
jgi:hypothetical protein